MRSLTGALWSVAFVCVAAPGCGRTQPSHAADGGMASDASMRLQPPSGGRSSAGSGGSAPTGAGRAAPASGAGGQTDDLDAGTPPTRPLLATSGAQLVISGPQLGLQLTAANLAEDADLFAVHQEFYGIPWAAFEAGTPPPAPWSDLLMQLAAAAKRAQRGVFLSVSMLNGARERLAATTRIEADQVKTDDATTDRCYDFASAPDRQARERAYLAYLDFMLALFEPRYLNLAVEVNLFFEKCPSATPALVQLINRAYAHVKAAHPDLAVFPSFQIDHLYGYAKDSCPDQSARDACFERGYAQLRDIQRDRFAMSSYPYLNGIGSPDQLPKDWFERGPRVGKERGLIAETGWLSSALVARASSGCQQVFDFDEAQSAAYLERVLTDASRLPLELVTWWSDRDLLPTQFMTNCPCSFEKTWCEVLDIFRGAPVAGAPEAQFYGEVLIKAFGSLGLRHYDGTPKTAALELWTRARR